MTEIPVDTDDQNHDAVNPLAFALALFLAPLIIGLPSAVVVTPYVLLDVGHPGVILLIPFAIVAFASIVGAPTYLLFGGTAFYLALKRRGSEAGLVFPALLANIASAPAVLVGYLALEGADGGALLSTLAFVLLGCIFAPIWAWFFASIYRAILKRRAIK